MLKCQLCHATIKEHIFLHYELEHPKAWVNIGKLWRRLERRVEAV